MPDYPVLQHENGIIKIKLSDLKDRNARFYSIIDGGKKITFFAVMDSKGNFKTAVNACASCYRKKMGYRQEDRFLVCNACGNKFEIDRIDQGLGSCTPFKVESYISGDLLIIKAEDILSRRDYF